MTGPGSRFGPYEIVALLGRGGMGEVYRARDTRLGREVALKVISGEAARDPDRLRRFELEARAASALNHPHIVTVYDVGAEQGSPYIVAELVEGRTLRSVLEDGALRPEQIVDIAAQITDGLTAAHEASIVHRDLKPENVMITRDGRAKILDFGLAKWPVGREAAAGDATATEALTQEGTVLGTTYYLSPEQARGQPVDFRSDQ